MTEIIKQGGYAAEEIYGCGNVEMNAALDYQGIDIIRDGGGILNNQEANWAILYAPGLRLPPLSLSAAEMTEGGEYCVAYYENEWFWSRSFTAQKITPTRVCGKTGGQNHLHREILWGGAFKKQNGFWGAPVLNAKNEIVGIISYKYTNDFQRSGVLELESFRDAVKAATE